MNGPIPQEWIMNYVDQLLAMSKLFDPGPMQAAILLRVEHVLNLVEAYREAK